MTIFDELPKEVTEKIFACLKEDDEGNFNVNDMNALLEVLIEYGEQYPVILKLIQPNEEALVNHFLETGEVPPGVRIIEKATSDDSNIIELKIHNNKKQETNIDE